MFDVLFKNATVITMTDEKEVLDGAFVGVVGEKIAYVSKETPEDTSARRTVDCRGDILMPGLVNCHAHTAMTLLRGFSDDSTLNDWLFNYIFPAESKFDLRAVEAGFKIGVAEMLSTGTTSFSDMYFYSDAMAAVADEIGIRACMSNGIIALSDDYEFEKDRAVTELLCMLQNKSFSNRIKPQVAIHCERTSSPDVWKKAVKLAKEYQLAIHVHLSETAVDHDSCVKEFSMTPARRLLEYGVFDVPVIAAHCVHVTEDDMKILAEKGVTAVHNPVSNLKLASGIADVCKMRDMGVNVALGTDGCSSNNTLDMFEDMKLSALLAKNIHGEPSAFTAYDALRLATVNGAKAQGNEGITGRIKENYAADMILINTHKLHRTPMYDAMSCAVYCLGGNDVYMTMVAGKVLYENGRFTTMDVEQAVRTATEYVMPLVRGVL